MDVIETQADLDAKVAQHAPRKWKRKLTTEEVQQRLDQLRPANGTRIAGEINGQLEGALFNDGDPQYFLDKETPKHRKMIDMHIAGYTNKEISELIGCTPNHVSNVVRQPWARAYIVKETKKTVQEEMRDFLEGEVMPTLLVVRAVRDNPEARTADRLSASAQLLDRFLGKPVQPMTTEQVDPSKLSSEDLERMAKEIVGGVSPTQDTAQQS